MFSNWSLCIYRNKASEKAGTLLTYLPGTDTVDEGFLSTHLQTLFVDADHHPRLLTLHSEAYIQEPLLLLRLPAFPGPIVQEGGQWQIWKPLGIRWGEGKGQAGTWRCTSSTWERVGVTQNGKLWGKHALQKIHHIWKSQSHRPWL